MSWITKLFRTLRTSNPPVPPSLRQEHIAGATLFASRHHYLATLPKGGVCAEVGVWRGDFSDHILNATKPTELHLIDINFARFDVRRRFKGYSSVKFHEGRSADVLAAFPDEHFDWIYIDAGHDYENVKTDATLAAQKIKADGLLIFNDYTMWSHREGCVYGVVQTVNEMCVNEGWRMVAFCLQPEMYCDVALRRSGGGGPEDSEAEPCVGGRVS
jgi:hypothetical protein